MLCELADAKSFMQQKAMCKHLIQPQCLSADPQKVGDQ